MSDERQGKPSASIMERLALCPGSWNLTKDMPEQAKSEDASSGDRIHASLADPKSVNLTIEEQHTADRCLEIEEEIVRLTLETPHSTHNEHRMWADNRWSGKADRVHLGNTAESLIIDFKSGRNATARAEGNLQLRALAVLVTLNHRTIQKVYVSIISPWQSPSFTIAEYSVDDLRKSSDQINRIVEASDKSDAPRWPGEKQCQYCKGKMVCPEFSIRNKAVIVKDKPSIPALTGEEIKDWLDRFKMAKSFIKAIEEEAKARLEADPQSIPGYTLKPGGTMEKIVDIEKLYGRIFKEYALNGSEFAKFCGITKTNLEALITEYNPEKLKGKEMKEKIAWLIDGLTQETPKAPSLERIK